MNITNRFKSFITNLSHLITERRKLKYLLIIAVVIFILLLLAYNQSFLNWTFNNINLISNFATLAALVVATLVLLADLKFRKEDIEHQSRIEIHNLMKKLKTLDISKIENIDKKLTVYFKPTKGLDSGTYIELSKLDSILKESLIKIKSKKLRKKYLMYETYYHYIYNAYNLDSGSDSRIIEVSREYFIKASMADAINISDNIRNLNKSENDSIINLLNQNVYNDIILKYR